MQVKIVHPQSKSDFDKYYLLRWEILRKPWNQPKVVTPVDGDEDAIHFMALDENNTPLAVCRLQFNTKTEAQVRFVAVSTEAQGKGIGKMIMDAAEQYALDRGAKQMILQARENALVFYEKMGYSVIEKTHLLFGEIQHYLMRKYF